MSGLLEFYASAPKEVWYALITTAAILAFAFGGLVCNARRHDRAREARKRSEERCALAAESELDSVARKLERLIDPDVSKLPNATRLRSLRQDLHVWLARYEKTAPHCAGRCHAMLGAIYAALSITRDRSQISADEVRNARPW